MTTGGWINMLLSVGFVTVLFAYCIVRVIKGPGARKEHGLARVEPIEKDIADER
ncbi:hypothetical protein ASA1KI_46230 [Opitutales bacterium ASA1]|uniref:hypothetical protein n=1 Tax=Congregicoccus parvus TaxID=3081749 RepID=UPI002B282429|nr:hypothetical protein ASA1KI_46230 [Opitutales bacterium ASA1]